MDRAEVAEPLVVEQTWRLLWSHAAYQVIAALPCAAAYERISVGSGWGLRSRANPRRALLLHPSGRGREVGELSLTIPGAGTQAIPRCGYSYVAYLDAVADIVATSARAYLDGTS